MTLNSTLSTPKDHPVNRTFMISCLLGFPPICITGQIILSYIIYFKKRKKYNSSFFKLLLFLIIPAVYWSHMLLYEGLCLYFEKCPAGDGFNIGITSNALYFYDVCMFATLFIAFNRFSAIFFFQRYERIFSKKMTKIYTAVIFVGSAIVNIPNWVYGLKYSTELATWTYVNIPTENMRRLLKIQELTFAYSIHAAVFLLYLSAFIRYRRRSVKTEGQRKEYKIMILGTFGSVACFLLLTFHHVWKVPTVEFMSFLLCVGSEPFVYLGFNSEMRKDFLDMVYGIFGCFCPCLRRSRVNPYNTTTHGWSGNVVATPASQTITKVTLEEERSQHVV